MLNSSLQCYFSIKFEMCWISHQFWIVLLFVVDMIAIGFYSPITNHTLRILDTYFRVYVQATELLTYSNPTPHREHRKSTKLLRLRLPWAIQSRASFAMSFGFFLRVWPTPRLLNSQIEYKSSFEILSGHRTLKEMCRRNSHFYRWFWD